MTTQKIKRNNKKSKKNLKGGSRQSPVRCVKIACIRFEIEQILKDNNNFDEHTKLELSQIIGILMSIQEIESFNEDKQLIKTIKEFISSIKSFEKSKSNNVYTNIAMIDSIISYKNDILKYIESKSNYLQGVQKSLKNSIPQKKSSNQQSPSRARSPSRASLPIASSLPRARSPPRASLPRAISPPRASLSRESSLRNARSMLNLELNGLRFQEHESGGGGDCLFYSIVDSIKYVNELLNTIMPDISFDIFKDFNKCLQINNFEIDNIDLYTKDEDIQLIIKYQFMVSCRELLALEIGNNVLLKIAKKDNPRNNEQARLSTLYHIILNSGDSYRDIIDNTFKEILNDAPTINEFETIYTTEKLFNNKIAVLTKKQGIYANDMHIRILNLMLSKCKISNTNFILKIEALNQGKIKGITKIIQDNYKNNIITIPIKHLDYGHFRSLELLL